MKNFLFIPIITVVIRSWIIAIAIGVAKNSGKGQAHITWPMEIYIRTTRNTKDTISLFFSIGVSLSSRTSASSSIFLLSSLRDAAYPAFSTALITEEASALPSTVMEEVRRDTETLSTPSTFFTALSTLLWHAAQLMPPTLYSVFII